MVQLETSSQIPTNKETQIEREKHQDAKRFGEQNHLLAHST
jgi:hypothetical protein